MCSTFDDTITDKAIKKARDNRYVIANKIILFNMRHNELVKIKEARKNLKRIQLIYDVDNSF